MVGSRTQNTSLWALVEAMQQSLEGEGLEASAVDAEVARGLRSLLWRDMFAGTRRVELEDDPLIPIEPNRA